MAEETPKKKSTYNGKANLVPFTPMNAKEMAALSAKVRQMRKQMRAKLLETAISEGIDKFFAKALKANDADGIAVVEKAAKLVGLDFGSSEEAITKVDVKSDTKISSNTPLQIKFVDATGDGQ